MRSITLEQLMLTNRDKYIAVANRTTVRAAFTLAGYANPHPIIYTSRNADAQFRLFILQAASATITARLTDQHARPGAVRASGLNPQNPRGLNNLALATTSTTSRWLTAGCSATSIARFATDTTAKRNIFLYPSSCFLKTKSHVAADIRTLA